MPIALYTPPSPAIEYAAYDSANPGSANPGSANPDSADPDSANPTTQTPATIESIVSEVCEALARNELLLQLKHIHSFKNLAPPVMTALTLIANGSRDSLLEEQISRIFMEHTGLPGGEFFANSIAFKDNDSISLLSEDESGEKFLCFRVFGRSTDPDKHGLFAIVPLGDSSYAFALTFDFAANLRRHVIDNYKPYPHISQSDIPQVRFQNSPVNISQAIDLLRTCQHEKLEYYNIGFIIDAPNSNPPERFIVAIPTEGQYPDLSSLLAHAQIVRASRDLAEFVGSSAKFITDPRTNDFLGIKYVMRRGKPENAVDCGTLYISLDGIITYTPAYTTEALDCVSPWNIFNLR